MKSIMATYPGFQELPRGIKRLLLTSEDYFFNDAPKPTVKPVRVEIETPHPLIPVYSASSNPLQRHDGPLPWTENTSLFA